MAIRRCVFKNEAGPNDPVFFEKVMGVLEHLEQRGLGLELMSDEESVVTRLEQMTWQHRVDHTTELSLIKNLHYDLCYVSMQSKLAWIPKLVVSSFESVLECYTVPELLEAISGRFVEARLVFALGLLARKPDTALIAALVKALDNDLASVRYAAAHAVALTRWPVFVSDLELLLKMETDQDVQLMGEYALGLLERLKK